MYIHEQPDWPRLHWNDEALAALLADVRHRQGRLIGRMEALGFDLRREAVAGTLVEDVVKSSDIEGERLDAGQVRSSVARRLGMDAGGMRRADRDVEGVVEMMLDATRRYDEPLTAERLFDWHASLFPTGRNGMRRTTVGIWRNSESDPMQVVSGPAASGRTRAERPPVPCPEPPPRRPRWQADHLEVGEAREVLTGHGPAGHRVPGRPRRPGPQSRRRAQHELPTRGEVTVSRAARALRRRGLSSPIGRTSLPLSDCRSHRSRGCCG